MLIISPLICDSLYCERIYIFDVARKGGSEEASQFCRRVEEAWFDVLRLLKQRERESEVQVSLSSDGSNYVCAQKIGRGKYS